MWAASCTGGMLILHIRPGTWGARCTASLGDSADAFIEWLVALVREVAWTPCSSRAACSFAQSRPSTPSHGCAAPCARKLATLTTVILTSGEPRQGGAPGAFRRVLTPLRGDGPGDRRPSRPGGALVYLVNPTGDLVRQSLSDLDPSGEADFAAPCAPAGGPWRLRCARCARRTSDRRSAGDERPAIPRCRTPS